VGIDVAFRNVGEKMLKGGQVSCGVRPTEDKKREVKKRRRARGEWGWECFCPGWTRLSRGYWNPEKKIPRVTPHNQHRGKFLGAGGRI